MQSRSAPSPPQHTWGQSPLGSCFLSRHLIPLSRASTSGCLREEEAVNIPSPVWVRPPLAAAKTQASPSAAHGRKPNPTHTRYRHH